MPVDSAVCLARQREIMDEYDDRQECIRKQLYRGTVQSCGQDRYYCRGVQCCDRDEGQQIHTDIKSHESVQVKENLPASER